MARSSRSRASVVAFRPAATRAAIGLLTSRQSLAVIDQAVVSAASFATTVLIGRHTDPDQLGLYVLAGSVLIWLVIAQEALVSLPYTLGMKRATGSPAGRAGGALLMSATLSIMAGGAIAATAAITLATGSGADTPTLICALAAAAPFVIHRDFARRFAFAHLRVTEALALDGAVAVLQLSLIGWLAWASLLSSATALIAIGLSCGAAGLAWLWLVRVQFQPSAEGALQARRESWNVGKWLLANQVLPSLQVQISFWLVAITVGTAATGVYAACTSIAMLANPLVLGLSNVLWPKAARVLDESGRSGLLRQSVGDAIVIGSVVSAFCAVTFLAGERLLVLLFSGEDYRGHGDVVAVLALAQLASGVGVPASCAMTAMGYVRKSFALALFEAVVTLFLVRALTMRWGIPGAAYAMLLGSSAWCVARWLVVVKLSRDHPSSASQTPPLQRQRRNACRKVLEASVRLRSRA